MNRKRVVVITMVLLIIGVCLIFCYTSGLLNGLSGIIFEEQITERDINNPYVNDDFYGWKEIGWQNVEDIYIPEEWSMSVAEQGIFAFHDENGNIIAYMSESGNASTEFANHNEYLSFCTGQNIIEVDYIPAEPGIAIANACFSKAEMTTSGGEQKIAYVLYLHHNVDLEIFFPNEIKEANYDKLFAICQAIAFSCYYE